MSETQRAAAIYVRVSTPGQQTDMQEVELKQYAEHRGWSYVVDRDQVSGAKTSRPALDALMADLRKRKFDILVIWAWDRLARSLRQLLAISEECRLLNIDLVAVRQNVDTTVPAGRLLFHVLASVAEFERELLRQRVQAGMDQARRAGRRIGRPARRRFTQSEVERLHELRSQGVSVRQLAKEFGATQWMIAQATKDAVAV